MSHPNRIILIVDDDPDVCWALEHALRGLDVRCIRALDGKSALQAARSHRVALALLDAKLPDIDGLELARQIRCSDPGVAVMLISGYFYRDDRTIQAALEDGRICGFIGKPFLHAEIVEAIGRILSPRNAPPPNAPGTPAARRTGNIGCR